MKPAKRQKSRNMKNHGIGSITYRGNRQSNTPFDKKVTMYHWNVSSFFEPDEWQKEKVPSEDDV